MLLTTSSSAGPELAAIDASILPPDERTYLETMRWHAARRAEIGGWLAFHDGRVQVVDGMRAKGMEYDGVLLVGPEEIAAESPAGIRVLYVGLTRATHRLLTLAHSKDWLDSVAVAPSQP